MKYLAILLGLLLTLPAWAQSARFGSRMVSVGDTAERVREVAGAPDAVDSEVGETSTREHWTYRRRGRLIQLWLDSGKVVHLSDQKEQASGN